MNRKVLVLSLFIAFSQISPAQFFDLPELVNLCSSPDLEAASKVLRDKNWSLSDQDTSGTNGVDYYTWSYGIGTSEYYDEYSSGAPGYLNIMSAEGMLSGIYYTVFEFEQYNIVFNAMKSSGFKKYKGKGLNEDGVTTYFDGVFLLIYNIEDIIDDEDPEVSYTAYTIYLLKESAGSASAESGARKEYYPDGKLLAEYTLLNGEVNGIVKIYDPEGYVTQESGYKNGELNGVRKFYYPSYDKNTGLPIEESGQLYLVSTYENGEQSGTEIWYSHTSYRRFPCEITDSAGVVRSDTCRQLVITKGKEIINYKNGILHGKYELYDSSGALVIKGKYKNGMETGKWFRKPDENGEIL